MRSDLGWEIYPQGIYKVLKEATGYGLPIYVMENGIADAADSKRAGFIRDHLLHVHKAIEDGADVQGYFYWSLIDNFESPELRGFWPRFGLIEVDFENLARKPRKSFFAYRDIIRNNGVE